VARFGTWLFRKEAMGGGDLKMMGMVGAFLGIPGVLLTLFLGSLLGSLIFGPISWKTGKLVPFGIFLAMGAAVSYGWGDAIIRWYSANFLGVTY
jgi:leader peptidase (prepilin peptidase)/N-methyltransferase